MRKQNRSAWQSRYVTIVKPCLDRVLALVLLAATAPIALAVAAGVRLRLGDPVLYRQRRVGRGGSTFTLYKFRTMTPDRREQSLPFDGPDRRVSYEATHEPRHTPLGRFLRRWSLDELPQLWNVLRGDMSIVGPRPEVPEVVRRYADRDHQRHRVRPGLTGLWQVTARTVKPMEAGVGIDVDYAERVSPSMDCRILFATLPAVVRSARAERALLASRP